MSATTTKIEKKTPNILTALFSQSFQDKPLVKLTHYRTVSLINVVAIETWVDFRKFSRGE
ncbi:MAG: hypothetical protein NVS1B11_32390 [Terriglobales bacterium]